MRFAWNNNKSFIEAKGGRMTAHFHNAAIIMPFIPLVVQMLVAVLVGLIIALVLK